MTLYIQANAVRNRATLQPVSLRGHRGRGTALTGGSVPPATPWNRLWLRSTLPSWLDVKPFWACDRETDGRTDGRLQPPSRWPQN